MPLANMPSCGKWLAPKFNNSQPKELKRYFTNLELLLNHHTIVDEQDRKQATLNYLKFQTESL